MMFDYVAIEPVLEELTTPFILYTPIFLLVQLNALGFLRPQRHDLNFFLIK